MKEALFYQKLKENQTKCNLCNHHCQLADGGIGICGARQNLDGKLYSLSYSRLITEAVDPIEKKPIFHFLPGSYSYSIATVGCNFRCANCHNWQISQAEKSVRHEAPSKIELPGYDVTAEEVVKRAMENSCLSISYTYTEPTIFAEFALDCMKLARLKGLKNVWVSNGYMTKQCLDVIIPYLDAINVDLKFFEDKYYLENCGAKLQPVLGNLKYLCQRKVALEITTLLIPGLTDLENQPERIAEFIAKELSVDIPWHISRFSPEISYKMHNGKTTPDKLINEVYQIGKKAGLNYVYTGNVWQDMRENTYCPKCQTLVIKRLGYQITRFDNQGKCPKCNFRLPLKIS